MSKRDRAAGNADDAITCRVAESAGKVLEGKGPDPASGLTLAGRPWKADPGSASVGWQGSWADAPAAESAPCRFEGGIGSGTVMGFSSLLAIAASSTVSSSSVCTAAATAENSGTSSNLSSLVCGLFSMASRTDSASTCRIRTRSES